MSLNSLQIDHLNKMCPVAKNVQLGTLLDIGDTRIETLEDRSVELGTMLAGGTGSHAYGVLNVSGVVIDTETITIGDDVYEVEQINTDTTKVTADAEGGGAIDDETNPVTFKMVDDAHGLVAGDLILVRGVEIMLVLDEDDEAVTALRGWGTPMVTHAHSGEVYKGAGYTAERIPVGMAKTVLTAEAFIDHFVKVMDTAKKHADLLSALDIAVTEPVTASKIDAANVAIVADEAGEDGNDIATTETFTNAAFRAATLVGGADVNELTMEVVTHTVTSGENGGVAYIAVKGEPVAMLFGVVDSDGAATGYDGKAVFHDDPDVVKFDASGDTDLTTGDVITLVYFI